MFEWNRHGIKDRKKKGSALNAELFKGNKNEVNGFV